MTEKCNATIMDLPGHEIIECVEGTEHHGLTDHRNGDWHWSDTAKGAKPHDTSFHRNAVQGSPPAFDTWTGSISFGREGDPENLAQVTASGSATFVAAVVRAAGDAFEEDGTR